MQAIVVHPNEAAADAPSLTAGLRMAKPGDVVLLGPGRTLPV